MRILMLSDVYFPRINGVSTSIQTFRRELQALGHEVTLVVPRYRDADADDADTVRVPSSVVPFDPEDRLMHPRALGALLGRLRKRRFDVIHIQTPFLAHYAGTRCARRWSIPCVESYHTFFEEYFLHYLPWIPASWTRAIARRLSRRQCNSLDGLVTPSTAMLRVLREYGVSTPAWVIPTGIDRSHWPEGDGAKFRARHGIGADRPVLVHVGRVAFEKNIGFLLRVVATLRRDLPDVLLVIAGEGPAVPALRREASALGIEANVQFVGYQSRAGDLSNCYRAGDVFVFASRTETQGLVLIEAMALGVPIVSTAHMGTAEVLQEGEGAVIARDDVADFSASVARLLGDPDARAALGARGRAHARRWSSQELARSLADCYAALLARER